MNTVSLIIAALSVRIPKDTLLEHAPARVPGGLGVVSIRYGFPHRSPAAVRAFDPTSEGTRVAYFRGGVDTRQGFDHWSSSPDLEFVWTGAKADLARFLDEVVADMAETYRGLIGAQPRTDTLVVDFAHATTLARLLDIALDSCGPIEVDHPHIVRAASMLRETGYTSEEIDGALARYEAFLTDWTSPAPTGSTRSGRTGRADPTDDMKSNVPATTRCHASRTGTDRQ